MRNDDNLEVVDDAVVAFGDVVVRCLGGFSRDHSDCRVGDDGVMLLLHGDEEDDLLLLLDCTLQDVEHDAAVVVVVVQHGDDS